MDNNGRRPLDDVLVVDLTRALSGPICASILADYGARVIKVEGVGGDNTRGGNTNKALEHDNINGGDSFNSINRNKDGISLNLRAPEGMKILKELCKKADVLLSNYRPGITEVMGIDYEHMKEINPRLICCEISAFREKGRENEPGFDVVVQAASGTVACTGYPGQPPAKPGPSLADMTSGLVMVQGIVMALYNREKTGKGQSVKVKMQDAAMFLTAQYASALLDTPDWDFKPSGLAHIEATPSCGFEASDGYVYVAPAGPVMFRKFCELLGHPELPDDPRFKDHNDLVERREEFYDIIRPIFKTKTVHEWYIIFRDAGMPVSPVSTPKQAWKKAQEEGAPIVATIHHRKHGDLHVAGPIIAFSDTPGRVTKPAPRLGQNTKEVLHDMLGYSDEEIAKLEADKVVFCLKD